MDLEDSRPSILRVVVDRALWHLINIQDAFLAFSDSAKSHELLSRSDYKRVIDGLLDLISLEGIYPNLLPGVGVPIEHRVKSILQGGVVSRTAHENELIRIDVDFLGHISSQLRRIGLGARKGIWPLYAERTLVDEVALEFQLAYSPRSENVEEQQSRLRELVDQFVIARHRGSNHET